MTVLIEACVETAEAARDAAAGGAGRIELCSQLEVQGTTPSPALVAQVRRAVGIPLHVLVRPRGGDFRYSGDEVGVMRRDIAGLVGAGVEGVVLGALDQEGWPDREVLLELLGAARPLSVTFHRAFDAAPDPFEALATLMALGVDRVLTSGHATSAEVGIPVLKELVRRASGPLSVLAGGAIREHNAKRIVQQTGVSEIHLRSAPGAESVRAVRAALGGPV